MKQIVCKLSIQKLQKNGTQPGTAHSHRMMLTFWVEEESLVAVF